jgi:hypothetical protein
MKVHSELRKPRNDCCPTCGRAFCGINDFPRVHVLAFEPLPIPEAVDGMSWAAAEKRLARRRSNPDAAATRRNDGINMTLAIAAACERPDVQSYFNKLAAFVNKEVAPDDLRPLIPADGMFQWAHPVGDTGIYLSLDEVEDEDQTTVTSASRKDAATCGERVAEIQVHCEGMNLGSAGGPTLQPLGAVARIRYRGLLLEKQGTVERQLSFQLSQVLGMCPC